MASFIGGKTTEVDFLADAVSTDPRVDLSQHCQAYFYAGIARREGGDLDGARQLFEKCVATHQEDYNEYLLANAELRGFPNP